MDKDPLTLFESGVNDYWAGLVPDGWDHARAYENPYLAGWNLAAQSENLLGFWNEDDDVPQTVEA